MASVTSRVDDLDNKVKVPDSVPAVFLSLNESAIRLDLSTKHTEELVALLAPYFAVGEAVELNAKRNAGTNASPRSEILTGKAVLADTDEIRAWANSNGLEVADKGRISNKVYEAFNAWANDPANADKVDVDA
jgi:hypothetical protein